MKMKRVAAVVLAAALAAACQGPPPERGVAAKVNGRPIPTSHLDFAHGLRSSAQPAMGANVLEDLKSEFGQALAGLVVEELVFQELSRRGLEVTAAELKNAETAARAGYPGDSFERMLAEEGVDPAIWRERLRARTAMDKFIAWVIRPRISITPQEVQAYFRDNSGEFSHPAGVRYLRAESRSAEALGKALAEARKASSPVDVLSVFDDVSVHVQASPEEALPRAWREALGSLAPGQAGPVGKGGLGFQAFILIERTPARTEGLVQAYPLVEKRLMEAKLEKEFSAWLNQAVNTSVIEVIPALLPEKGGF